MIIDNPTFFKMLNTKQLAAKKITNGTAFVMVQRYYCVPMTMARKCTKTCLNCKASLEKAFEDVHTGADKPAGVLVYVLRKAVNETVEVEHVATVRTVDTFGTKDTSSVFDALLAEVS